MNILIPHTWLLEHLETDATPTEIQKYLSLCGPSIERIYEREDDSVYDIEVTTNRVDCMSVRGIAREAAVILPQFGKKAKLKKLPKREIPTPQNVILGRRSEDPRVKHEDDRRGLLPLPKITDAQKLSQLVMGVVLADAQRTPTPEWMAKRLRQIDAHVHDAVIDITNYITHDLGHPCHAFDYDAVMKLGGEIIITTAKAGLPFVTLDGQSYTTVGGEVVFENPAGEIIDLPGIKGTLNSSISTHTKNVLLWIESIPATKIRFGSMTHAIRTVAAQLNEKNVDPELALPVMEEGVALFAKLANAQVASKLLHTSTQKRNATTVKLPLSRIVDYLGVELPLTTIDRILRDLGCEVELKKQQLWVTPPSFRPDISIPADVIEEIARIYGYHNLPSVVMPTAIPLTKPTETNFTIEQRLKQYLADIGWQEVFTYSMVSEALALASGFPLVDHLKLQNPLTDDRVYLRRSLVPSLAEVLAQNPQRPELRVFELANVYVPRAKNLPNEKLCLTMLAQRPYREMRGVVEALLRQFYIEDIEVVAAGKKQGPYVQIGTIIPSSLRIRSAIHHGSRVKPGMTMKDGLGVIGVLPNGQVSVVIDLPALLKYAHGYPTYHPAPKTSVIHEDLTFTLPAHTEIGPVLTELRTHVSPLIAHVELSAVYQQNYTFSFEYLNPSKNLTVEDVVPVRKKIVTEMSEKYGAKLVGKLA